MSWSRCPGENSPVHRIGDRGEHEGHQEDVQERPEDEIAEEEHQNETYQEKSLATLPVALILLHAFLPSRQPAAKVAPCLGFSRFAGGQSINSRGQNTNRTQVGRVPGSGPGICYMGRALLKIGEDSHAPFPI